MKNGASILWARSWRNKELFVEERKQCSGNTNSQAKPQYSMLSLHFLQEEDLGIGPLL
jgi:hypothetical protein